MDRLRRLAEKNLETGLARLRRWWIDKYKLPPHHPLFVEQSIAEVNLEMLEDLLVRQKELISQLDDEPRPSEAAELRRQLAAINKALDEEGDLGDDPLIDEWERDVAEGRTPDFSK